MPCIGRVIVYFPAVSISYSIHTQLKPSIADGFINLSGELYRSEVGPLVPVPFSHGHGQKRCLYLEGGEIEPIADAARK